MSKLGEWLAWSLNRVFPPLDIHRELQHAKSGIAANQRWAYEEALRVQQAFQPHWELDGLDALDIGCGLGGKLPFYITEAGAKVVTGIDINARSTQIAHQHVASLGMAQQQDSIVQLVVSDAADLPFPNDSFDAIVSINVFEHIVRLQRGLRESFRVLRPGGLAFLHLPPYYSPWGPHLESWIHFPWPHLLFSDRTLMSVAAREDARLRLSSRFVDAARIDWKHSGDRIPGVNRVTLRRFERLVEHTGFSAVQRELLPVGHNHLRTGSPVGRLVLRLLRIVSHVPFLQEIIVTKMAFVLRKGP